MNKELALKLKQAGYPIKEFIYEGEHVIVPTLEELIEACGKEFLMLTRGWGKNEGKWFSSKAGKVDKRDIEFITEGPTPSEAVANLWLELNKK